MSSLSDALQAVRSALLLADEVRRTTERVQEMATDLRDHDRRITRLEAQWDTALAISSLPKLPRS